MTTRSAPTSDPAFDPEKLAPPIPPAQTHREERARLPSFPAGAVPDRLERARGYLRTVRAHVEARHRAGMAGLSVCRLISEGLDRLLCGVFLELRAQLKAPEGIALVALGGYGRRETAPNSDVDLLLLRGAKTKEDAVRPLAQAFSTLLWDLKLVVGWNVRTAEECARIAEADHTVRTALVDLRRLEGDPALFDELSSRALKELFRGRADRFIADKVAELKARREKFGDSVFVLEPNVKTGDGGLRDLEAALWIAFARYRARGLRELLRESVLPASRVTRLAHARDFLMRIRNHLHFTRGRKEDRLTFDLQEEVATFLGYAPSQQGLPVEQFMRHYYLSAEAIRRAADALIARCEEESPRRSAARTPERRLGPFKTFQGKLTFAIDPAELAERPELAVALYRTAEQEGLALYSWARDQVIATLPALAAKRADAAVVDELKWTLGRPGATGRAAVELHEDGVFASVLPEFGRITALHQHDLYHVYTVDVHSLFALRRLYSLREGALQTEEPELSRLMGELGDPLPLYLGMMLHDCGKGLGGNHSARGQELAAQVGERLGFTARQKELCEFLVLHHLTLSQTAQRRDLSDPELIASFAGTMGDVEKLTCLYLLTYADMCSVAPGTWNEWRSRLIRELYGKAKAHLIGEATGGDVRAAFGARWEKIFGAERAGRLSAILPERYFLGTPIGSATLHARLLRRAERQLLAGFLRQDRERGTSELTLCARDRPGLLAQLAGVLSTHGIDILRAQITSTSDGYALDVFDVKGPQGRPLDRKRWRAARTELLRVLLKVVTVEEVMRKRRPSPLLARKLPKVPTRVSVDNQASRQFSVVDVRAEDRVGLLYRIAWALREFGCEIGLAKIATEAHHAVDSFYVTKTGGRVTAPEEMKRLVAMVEQAISEAG